MRYHIKKIKEFGIKYAGDVETSVLKFLYNNRNGLIYPVKTIARSVQINPDSVRGALNRLHERRYVKKIWSRKDGRITLWRLRRNAKVYQIVEQRIGIHKSSSVIHKNDYSNKNPFIQDYRTNIFDRTRNEVRSSTFKGSKFFEPSKTHIKKDTSEHYIDKISKTTIKLSPLKTALQSAFPHIALPLEAGYQILSNLDTIRDSYNLTTDTGSYSLCNALNETVKTATRLAYNHVVNYVSQTIGNAVIPNIVETSSKYLEQKDIFKDITESLNLDESYSDDFKNFYDASLSNCLKNRINMVR
ncbi:MAG: MarR family transcriptional regulator [Nanoarchaeota archaeon]|nr:MarR family transcriptional regulator [Nanoarchaeota archaeon]